jgi:hypothetical protein
MISTTIGTQGCTSGLKMLLGMMGSVSVLLHEHTDRHEDDSLVADNSAIVVQVHFVLVSVTTPTFYYQPES